MTEMKLTAAGPGGTRLSEALSIPPQLTESETQP